MVAKPRTLFACPSKKHPYPYPNPSQCSRMRTKRAKQHPPAVPLPIFPRPVPGVNVMMVEKLEGDLREEDYGWLRDDCSEEMFFDMIHDALNTVVVVRSIK